MTKIIDERTQGHRLEGATAWPVRDLLTREQIPGKRAEWQIVCGLCNGVPERVETFRRLTDARARWIDSEVAS